MPKADKAAKADKGDVDRRSFLRSAGAGAAGAATAVVAGTASSPAEARESDADKKKGRYKETDHVKTYYRTNRY